MSISPPKTIDISNNIVAQLELELNQTIPLLPKSFLRVLAKVLSGVFVLLYKYGGFIFLQVFIETASAKDTEVNGQIVNPLKLWGRMVGAGDPVAATNAELTVNVTVETQTGSLPAGTQLVRTESGVTYLTTAVVLLNAATVSVNIRAASDEAGGAGKGVIGNLNVSDVVSFVNTLANVARDAVVSAVVVTGADEEATEVYRQRGLDRFQKRPQGGAYADYQQWGLEVAGIIGVYPYTSANPGQVDVFVEATVASSGSADGIPTAPQLQAVLDAVTLNTAGLANRRPASALANSFPILRTGFDVIVTTLVVNNLSQVQTDITTEVTSYFLSREPFIAGLSVLPRLDRITQSAVGGIVDSIVSDAGGTFVSVAVKEGAATITLRTLAIGEKSKASTVTFA